MVFFVQHFLSLPLAFVLTTHHFEVKFPSFLTRAGTTTVMCLKTNLYGQLHAAMQRLSMRVNLIYTDLLSTTGLVVMSFSAVDQPLNIAIL